MNKEQLHEEYGLSTEGKLPQHLSKEDLSDADWLSVFRVRCAKNTKIFLHMLRSEFFDECRLLYQKVYQAVPSNNEIGHKFARCFVYEKCKSAKNDPEGHRIAWAAFGENVLETCKAQLGLQKKIENWRKVYGPSHIEASSNVAIDIDSEVAGSNQKKKRPSQHHGGSLVLAHNPLQEKIPQVESMAATATQRLSGMRRELVEKEADFRNKRDMMMRNEGRTSAAAVLMTDMEKHKRQLADLNALDPLNKEHIQKIEFQIETFVRMLELLGVDEAMLNQNRNMAVVEVCGQPESTSLLPFLLSKVDPLSI